MTYSLLSYEELLIPLQKLDIDKDPSEIHGSLCGILCAKDKHEAQIDIALLIPELDSANLLHRECFDSLTELYNQTLLQLNDPNCEFYMLLPDENSTDLQTLVDALGDWCQGFLVGLSFGGITDIDGLEPDSAELVQDFVEIARAGSSYALEDSDDEQQAFTELLEYVRIGVLLIHEEQHPIRSAPIDTSVLH